MPGRDRPSRRPSWWARQKVRCQGHPSEEAIAGAGSGCEEDDGVGGVHVVSRLSSGSGYRVSILSAQAKNLVVRSLFSEKPGTVSAGLMDSSTLGLAAVAPLIPLLILPPVTSTCCLLNAAMPSARFRPFSVTRRGAGRTLRYWCGRKPPVNCRASISSLSKLDVPCLPLGEGARGESDVGT